MKQAFHFFTVFSLLITIGCVKKDEVYWYELEWEERFDTKKCFPIDSIPDAKVTTLLGKEFNGIEKGCIYIQGYRSNDTVNITLVQDTLEFKANKSFGGGGVTYMILDLKNDAILEKEGSQ